MNTKSHFMKYAGLCLLTLVSIVACKNNNREIVKSTTKNDTLLVKQGNPVITHKYTADPAALVYNDTVFLYAGHDEAPPRENRYVMNEWLIFYSTEMVNWTEHPEPLSTKEFKWAKGDAWAAQVVEKAGKFYWYVTVSHDSIPGKSIGVAVSDRPTGPFKDARGSAIITNDMTTKDSISWDDIDPTFYFD